MAALHAANLFLHQELPKLGRLAATQHHHLEGILFGRDHAGDSVGLDKVKGTRSVAEASGQTALEGHIHVCEDDEKLNIL